MDEWRKSRMHAPEESVLQIGKMEEHVDREILMDCHKDYSARLEKWNEAHGNPFTILTVALHYDEAVPHYQTRRVWHYQDKKGIMRIGQEKALIAAGVELPNPKKPERKHNNRKMIFDKMAREMWIKVLHEHGLEIDTIPLPDGKHNRDKEQMIWDKYAQIVEDGEKIQNHSNEVYVETLLQQMQIEELAEKIEDSRNQLKEITNQGTVAQQKLDALRDQSEKAADAIQEAQRLRLEVEMLRSWKQKAEGLLWQLCKVLRKIGNTYPKAPYCSILQNFVSAITSLLEPGKSRGAQRGPER